MIFEMLTLKLTVIVVFEWILFNGLNALIVSEKFLSCS
jgi:hypothetical protein